jgi:hypothetical protein
VERSDLLIHRDPKTSTPGTLGCIGVADAEFADFELIYNRECLALPPTAQTVDLAVIYTY